MKEFKTQNVTKSKQNIILNSIKFKALIVKKKLKNPNGDTTQNVIKL